MQLTPKLEQQKNTVIKKWFMAASQDSYEEAKKDSDTLSREEFKTKYEFDVNSFRSWVQDLEHPEEEKSAARLTQLPVLKSYGEYSRHTVQIAESVWQRFEAICRKYQGELSTRYIQSYLLEKAVELFEEDNE